MAHPLTNNDSWVFWQPYLAVKSTVLVVDPKDNGRVVPLSASNTCREGLVSNIRGGLWNAVMEQIPGRVSYDRRWKKVNRVRLFDPQLSEDLQGANQLRVHINALKADPVGGPIPSPEDIKLYLEVADAIVGMPCVLLSHRRPSGDWWRSPAERCGGDASFVSWNGSDNWFMRHPALLSAVSGLVRQAALLTARGFGEQVLECVDRDRVEEALTTGEWKLAYDLARKLRTWIEVPVGKGGATRNFSFPLGFWPRFDNLQRAQRRHNYKKIFGDSFYDSWGLKVNENQVQTWSGSFSFWGERGNFTDAHRRLMDLGRARRRAGRGKGATKDS